MCFSAGGGDILWRAAGKVPETSGYWQRDTGKNRWWPARAEKQGIVGMMNCYILKRKPMFNVLN